MPSHQIFNERPESQDRALKELQAMGYQYIPRAEARPFVACTVPGCYAGIFGFSVLCLPGKADTVSG